MSVSVSSDMPVETVAPSASLRVSSPEKKSEMLKGPARYLIQTGAFRTRHNAEGQMAKLASLGDSGIRESLVRGERFYRVTLGPVSAHDQAQQMLEQAKSLGFTDARILVE